MSFVKLERFEAEQRLAEAKRLEDEKRRELKRKVKEALPKHLRVPRRRVGRTAVGGVSRKEIAALHRQATEFLADEAGFAKMKAKFQHTAVLVTLLDGVLGTEPWRAAAGPHGALVAANARVRFLENATRILDELARSRGTPQGRLTEGVIEDAEYAGEERK